MKETTKVCPNCGSEVLIHYTSTNQKQCADCYSFLPWHLEAGQKPLIGPSRNLKPSIRA